MALIWRAPETFYRVQKSDVWLGEKKKLKWNEISLLDHSEGTRHWMSCSKEEKESIT